MTIQRRLRRQVFTRDKWTCLMPVCLHPCTRAINPALDGTNSPWAPSIDHIVPRALGGRDRPGNLRAAHQRCNNRAGRHLRRAFEDNFSNPEDILGGRLNL